MCAPTHVICRLLHTPRGGWPAVDGWGGARNVDLVTVELVIFDCDGVLVDSERLTIQVEVALLTELGWPMTAADVVERFMGRTEAAMVAKIEAHLGRPVPEFMPMYMAAQQAAFERDLTEVAGISTALDELEAWPVATCVASSGTHEKMAFTLGTTGLAPRFEGRIFSATQVAHGKPAPDLFLFAASQMGVDPAACVVVEDSPAGVAAARAAGMHCVAFSTPLVAPDRLSGPATTVIADMADLTRAIASLAGGPPERAVAP